MMFDEVIMHNILYFSSMILMILSPITLFINVNIQLRVLIFMLVFFISWGVFEIERKIEEEWDKQ